MFSLYLVREDANISISTDPSAYHLQGKPHLYWFAVQK